MRGGKTLRLTPLSPRRRMQPTAHGAAARVRPAALGDYSLQKSGTSDIGYPPPTVFPQRINLWPSSEVAAKALSAAGGRDREVQRGTAGGRLPESIQRILCIDIELGKNMLQWIDESIFLPTHSTLHSGQVFLNAWVSTVICFLSLACGLTCFHAEYEQVPVVLSLSWCCYYKLLRKNRLISWCFVATTSCLKILCVYKLKKKCLNIL